MRVPPADRTAWLDGVPTPTGQLAIPLSDPAVLVGHGLFETVALRDGHPLELAAHLDRLEGSARALAMPHPPRDELERICRAAVSAEPSACGWLKVLLTGGGRSIVFTGPMEPEEDGAPVRAVLLPWRRDRRGPLVGIKTTSYAANRLALDHARRRGADEGLWLNGRGHLCEACFANLFLVERGRLFTPGRREGLLPGVVRATVIRVARAGGIAVHETRVRTKRLARCDEAFLTSSLGGVRPLVMVDGRAIGGGVPGPLTRRLAELVGRTRRGHRC
ncbi:MAG TPA: aminotransferase class IV [Candidatus Polarisedimenticolaceae bacterium]|nr:aminotransferase class IV [Candidatus Polarisedimenticolaceae bacterium]